MASKDDELKVNVTLDMDKAADDLRHNPALDDLFSKYEESPEQKAKRVSEYQDRQRARQEEERWKNRSKEEKLNDHYKYVNYQRMVREGVRLKNAEEKAQRDNLKRTVVEGRKKIKEEEAANEKKLKKDEAERKRAHREELNHRRAMLREDREEQRRKDRSGGLVGASVSGFAAGIVYKAMDYVKERIENGFQGSQVQNALDRENMLVDRELANAFKPIKQGMLRAVKKARTGMEGLSTNDQDRLYEGALGFAINPLMGLYEVFKDRPASGETGPGKVRELGHGGGVNHDLLKRQQDWVLNERANLHEEKKSRSTLGMLASTIGLNDQRGYWGYDRDSRELSNLKNDLDNIGSGKDAHRRNLFADTVGFGAAGSTSELIQTDLLRMGADDGGKDQTTLLEQILGVVSDIRSGPGTSAQARLSKAVR